ncbi:MAG: putative glutamate uptake system ATP-binding protein, partial [Glaciihabitans sp.]|nr:putative glutamate uptake system ATP-binding protein [Glaciihabitans sp.]
MNETTRNTMDNEAHDPMIRIRDLNVSFGSAHVLRDVSLTVERGRTIGVVGESGSGKSTLAKTL